MKQVEDKILNPGKYIVELNKFSSDIFDVKIKQANLLSKASLNKKARENEKKIPDTADFLTKNRGDFIIKDVDSNQK